jgi:hypothetical protein
MTMRAPSGQKVRASGLFPPGMGSAKVIDDGSAPAIAAIAPDLITLRRDIIVSLPKRSAQLSLFLVGRTGRSKC